MRTHQFLGGHFWHFRTCVTLSFTSFAFYLDTYNACTYAFTLELRLRLGSRIAFTLVALTFTLDDLAAFTYTLRAWMPPLT